MGLVVVSLAGGCSSAPEPVTPTTTVDTTPATAPRSLSSIPVVTVTIPEQGALTVDRPAAVAAGLVLLSVRNQRSSDRGRAAEADAGVIVVAPASESVRGDLEGALVVAPERIDELAVHLGGAAPLAPGASQDVIVRLPAGASYLARTGPGPTASVMASRPVAAPLVALVVSPTAPDSADPSTPSTPSTPGTTITDTTMGTSPASSAPAGTTSSNAGPTGTGPVGTVVPAAAPTTQSEQVDALTIGTIELSDYDASLPDDLRPGWYRVINRGPQVHQLAILAIDEGRSSREVTTALEQRALTERTGAASPSSAPPGTGDPNGTTLTTTAPPATEPPVGLPAHAEGGIGALAPGGDAWVHISLPSGAHLAICSEPAIVADNGQSESDQLPHHAHGFSIFVRVP